MKKQKRNIKRELEICQASTLTRLATAYNKISTVNKNNFLSSAITITIKNINSSGKEIIIEEFAIFDGLSNETIEKLKNDILESHSNLINHPINKIK